MDKKTILVIDDAPSNLILLNNLLCKDYRVKVANSGSRGIKLALADDAPDLILLDVVMPELNGFEVCDVLKKTERPDTSPLSF
jgi:putative two-component system response regulator